MFAAGMSRAGRHVIKRSIPIAGPIALALSFIALAGCASEPLAYDPALVQQPAPAMTAHDERPAFYLEWKGGTVPGLTQAPAFDRTSKLPEYPASSKRNREEGMTVLDSCVTAEGRLVDVHLAKSSGHSALDQATLTWARIAKYKPAMFGAEALAVCGFRLEWVWDLTGGER